MVNSEQAVKDMSLDTIIAILGFAVSLGGFVPLLLLKDHRREIGVIALVTAVCVLAATHGYQTYKHDQETAYVKRVILSELAARDSTYEDLRRHFGDVNPTTVTSALQEMVRKQEISAGVVLLHDLNGQTFDVYLYKVERSPR